MGTCPGVPWVGPAWCGASRGCFGDVVVVYVPQWPNTCDTCSYRCIPTNTCDTCSYIIHTYGYLLVPSHTRLQYTDRAQHTDKILTYSYIYMQIVVNSYSEVSVPKIDAYTYTYIQYLHIPTMQIPTNTYVDRYWICMYVQVWRRYHVGILALFWKYWYVL